MSNIPPVPYGSIINTLGVEINLVFKLESSNLLPFTQVIELQVYACLDRGYMGVKTGSEKGCGLANRFSM